MSESNSERLSPVILGTSPSHAERARTLVEVNRQATLCTLLAPHLRGGPPRGHDAAEVAEPESAPDPMTGHPYGSVVNYAIDAAGHPLLLTSTLAEHTRNFKADPRASLFVNEVAGNADVLALGRVTLMGSVEAAPEPEVRERYLARHPESGYYADFKDFAFYRLRVAAIRYIGGFGRMSWTDVDAYAQAEPDPTSAFAPSVLRHMNEDHRDALVRLCRHHAGLDDVEQAELKGIDCYGFEMTATTSRGPRFVRLGFPGRITTPDETRSMFMLMLKEARAE